MGVATLDIIKLNKQGGKTEKKEKKKEKTAIYHMFLWDVYNLNKLFFFSKI